MDKNKIRGFMEGFNKKIPFDVKDITITAGFIAVLLAAYAGKNLHDEYVERVNNQPQIIEVGSVIEVGEDGIAYRVNYYTESTSPVTYTDAVTGEICYAAPAGYSLTYDVNGEPVCTRTYIERDSDTIEVSKTK
nr:hypothetical protein [Bacilli bacterium]